MANNLYQGKKSWEVLADPLVNKDTAFSEEQRETLQLNGLLPPHVESLKEQLKRAYEALTSKESPLEKHIYLRALQDRNEVLFYSLIQNHIAEIMPIIYTPVVGDACKLFSHIYRKPRGLFISYPLKDKIDTLLDNVPDFLDVKVIVVTDGERILGLGDQGVDGMGIPIGKLSLYSACGGIHPRHTLPIVLDVGTNNKERREDGDYLGWRHERITGDDYLAFVDLFVDAVKRKFPHVLLQFEDFAQQHAYPLLKRYREKLCVFNDDIQGTAAVAASALLAATKVVGNKLSEHRIAVLGAGSAGCGIAQMLVQVMVAEGLSEKEAYQQFYLVDRFGLLHTDMNDLLPFQQPFAKDKSQVDNFSNHGQISLADVVAHAKPTILLGVSGQPKQFTQEIVEKMSSYCERPIIFPMSNPTSRCEAAPADLIQWTKGQALVATGSPFDDVHYQGNIYQIAQSNNAYIFPGVGLGVLAVGARFISDEMFMSATIALSELAPALKEKTAPLLPPLANIHHVSQYIAFAVAKKACEQGHADKLSDDEIKQAIKNTFWQAEYADE